MATNLPITPVEDSAAQTKLFFNNYGNVVLEFPSNDVDATIGFLTGKGFDYDAALVVGETILKQAKIDGTPIFEILDTLSGFNTADLSILVGQILNNNRVVSSTLGFRTAEVVTTQTRNISA
jgi:hypothetical protein